MGCDIHLHTEVKINGVWHHYGAPSIDRNYSLFGKMAGVRGDEEPIAASRGIPEDATALTRFDFSERWRSDAHSASWLNAAEIDELCRWAEAQSWGKDKERSWLDWETCTVGYFFGNSWSGFTRYPQDRLYGVEDIRWIFWFDN